MPSANEVQSTAAWASFLSQGLLGPKRLIENAPVEISSVSHNEEIWPVTINRAGDSECSWVASLRNAYGPYARAEVDLVKTHPALSPLYKAASHAAEALLSVGNLTGGIFLNNWLLATNLYSSRFTSDGILQVLSEILQQEPSLPVVIRSLVPCLHESLMARLCANGFLLLPSRQVWILADPANGEWRAHRDARRDLQFVAASIKQWEWIEGNAFSDRDYSRALGLYQRLYRQRYPRFNPSYTEDFLRIGVATGFLTVFGLREVGCAEISGVVGMAHRETVSCTPVLGYDLDRPSSDGLYRRLTLRAFTEAESRKTVLHCSAGAGAFKFSRGANAHVEFCAIWANHLPIYRRASLRTLSAAVKKWLVPYIASHRF